jgi:lipopolysaccharide/colanic/teichoic acid biosynthesis glycosyltransferase
MAKSGLPRWFNLLAALLGVGLLAPIYWLLWLLIGFDSPGQPLFSQPRVGLGGRSFRCYKFRTMANGVSPSAIEIGDFGSFVFNPPGSRRDPRLTRLGQALRSSSMDELPQLLNVVRGEMALVGPRPELPEIVTQYPHEYHRRHDVPPGLSGLAQIRGRADLTYARGVAYDLAYVDHRSARLDLEILFHTLPVVARGTGAR